MRPIWSTIKINNYSFLDVEPSAFFNVQHVIFTSRMLHGKIYRKFRRTSWRNPPTTVVQGAFGRSAAWELLATAISWLIVISQSSPDVECSDSPGISSCCYKLHSCPQTGRLFRALLLAVSLSPSSRPFALIWSLIYRPNLFLSIPYFGGPQLSHINFSDRGNRMNTVSSTSKWAFSRRCSARARGLPWHQVQFQSFDIKYRIKNR